MGMFMSRISGYSSVLMMDTAAQVHFADTMRRSYSEAQAAQQLQTFGQLGATGNLGGSGGGGGGGSPIPGQGWFQFGQTMAAFAPYAIVISGGVAGAVYAFKLEQYMMFIALFICLLFLLFFVLFKTRATMAGTLSGRNFWISFFGAALGSFLVAFVLYKGPEATPEEIMQQQQQLPPGYTTFPTDPRYQGL